VYGHYLIPSCTASLLEKKLFVKHNGVIWF